jgi:hypothetical protein
MESSSLLLFFYGILQSPWHFVPFPLFKKGDILAEKVSCLVKGRGPICCGGIAKNYTFPSAILGLHLFIDLTHPPVSQSVPLI